MLGRDAAREVLTLTRDRADATEPASGGNSTMATLTVYSKPDCHLCAEAMRVLRRLQAEHGFGLQELDITADEALHRAYFERIPVVYLDGEELFEYFVDEAVVRERLESRR
jgi:glutaredoxin